MTRKNQIITAVAVVIIIVLGLVGYFLYGQKSQTATGNQTTNQAMSPTPGSSLESTITDLFKSDSNKKCTFDSKTDSGETMGTVYVTKDMAKADFTMTTKGKATVSHLIRNANTFYIWGDSFPTGIKMTMDINEMAEKMNSTSYSAFDPNQKANYNCEDWSVDSTLFTPPSDLKFTDLSAMMPKTSVTGTQTKSNPCAAISDTTAKAACESALQGQGY